MSSSSSSTPSPSRDRDQQLLAVGRQCSHPSCRLVDFLPFKCQHCANSFCADHFKPAAHSCAKYDEAKFNRVVPDCPLCNEPVPIPPGQDPNIRMERHLSIDCSVMTGRSQKASSTPRCARPKCGKLLFAQIQCDKCHQKFCPEHRFPSSHNCSSISSTVLPPASAPIKPSSQASAVSASGLAAIKRAASSVKPSAPSATKSSTVPPPTKGAASSSGAVASGSKTNTSHSNRPFSKLTGKQSLSPS
ncbi:hypothetical protein BJV77DRAFT_940913 [Russula vinacea]|nr:hypothetical protein BJV77DRAFT_940913 [Russula vinacea]